MAKWIAILCLSLGLCTAADLTGRWSGTLSLNNGDRPGYMVLTEKGQVITGTAGEDASKQVPITSGNVEGQNVVIEAKPGRSTLKFALVAASDNQALSGDVYEDAEKIGTVLFHRIAK